MKIEVSLGEVIDKITILDIKIQRLSTPQARQNATAALDALQEDWTASGLPAPATLPEYSELAEVNRALWTVEDDLRECERKQAFEQGFIELARRVYRLNDRRAVLKRSVDERLGSALVEEKSYSQY
jgi:hypothetical protein